MDTINPRAVRSILLGRGWASVTLCPTNLPQPLPTDDPDWTWQPLAFRGTEQARFYLSGLTHEAGMLGQLRHLLAIESHLPVSRLDTGQVLDAVAQLLAEHRWVVHHKALTAAAKIKKAQRQSSAASGPGDSQSVSPSRLRGASESTPAPQAAAAPETDFADINQNAQAATLTQAAEDGVPFCELCAKARALAA